MEASGYTGPYPTEAAGEGHSEIEGPGPGPAGGTDQSATEAPPSVATEGHSELEGPSPGQAGGTSQSATTAPPTVAASVGSSPGVTSQVPAAAGLGGGEAQAGNTAALPSVASPPIEPLGDEAGYAPGPGGQASGGRTGALPEVAATHYPAPYAPGAIYPSSS